MSGFALNRWERESRSRDPKDHWVYVIGRIDWDFEVVGPTKVGISSDPLKRMQALQTGCHDRLVLVSKHAFWKRRHAEIVEAAFHRSMSVYRLEGEWFDMCPVDACAVMADLLPKFVQSYLQPYDGNTHSDAIYYCNVPGYDQVSAYDDVEFPS